MRRVIHLFGTALVAFGLLVLLGVGGLYAYGTVERLQFERELASSPTFTPAPPPTALPTATATLEPSPSPASAVAGSPIPPPTATATSAPTPTPTPAISPARRIVAPKIGLDSKVVESEAKDGSWTVPKFVAGHLQGTADPGEGSNVVMAGHVESISSGNVFANIDKLSPGDWIKVYTDTAEFDYVVAQKKVVKNTDVSVVQPTKDEQLTLITCTGNWLPLQRDYDQRLIVVARRADWVPPVKPTKPGPL